jgi:hypothetical protein
MRAAVSLKIFAANHRSKIIAANIEAHSAATILPSVFRKTVFRAAIWRIAFSYVFASSICMGLHQL